MTKNRVKINIAGYDCAIISEESEGYIRSVCAQIDSKIRNMMKSNSNISTLMAAIVTSMDFCDVYRKSTQEVQNLEIRMKEYLEAATSLEVGAQKLKEENQVLRKRVADLEMRLRSVSIKRA